VSRLASEVEIDCPCCGATIVYDINLCRVVSHDAPPSAERPDLTDAQDILAAATAKREAAFQQSVADERGRGQALSKPGERRANYQRVICRKIKKNK
jgi:hypothetical protein